MNKSMVKQTSTKNKLCTYYLIYTAVFVAMALIVFASFWFNGKSFVWREDGINQHYNALVYLGQWGRQIIHDFIETHTWNIPLWDFNIGYGSDILTTLNYYVIGDPLDLLSILVPSYQTEYLYAGLIVLRLYLAGVCFSAFCFTLKQPRFATMAGSFCYIFCGYALYAAVRHPYFTNPMIYLPLLLIGVERVMTGKRSRPVLFTFMVFLSAISNFYFFYILVFAVIGYVVFRFFTLEHTHTVREFVKTVIHFLILGIIGTMMAAFLLYPVIMLLMGTSRANVELAYHPLYHWTYYVKLLTSFTTVTQGDYWAKTGFPAPALLALLLLFSEKKRHLVLKLMFLALTVLFLFPVFGSALNGFSYVTNRWCFVYAMLVAFILVIEWKRLVDPDKREMRWLLVGVGVYYVLMLVIDMGVEEATFASISVILIAMIFMLIMRNHVEPKVKAKRWMALGLFGLILMNCGLNSYYEYAYKEADYIGEFIDAGTLFDRVMTSGTTATRAVMNELKDEEFSRVEQEFADYYPVLNTATLNDVGSTQFYWSLVKGNISDYLQEMSVSGSKWSYDYRNLDERTMLTDLAGVKYFVTQDEEAIAPYGYELVAEVVTNELQMKEIRRAYRAELGVKKLTKEQYDRLQDKYARVFYVYENQHPLTFGYTYDSYITQERFEELTASEREEALLQGILMSDEDRQELAVDLREIEPHLGSCSLDYEMVPGDRVILKEDGAIFVGAADETLTLEFEGPNDCEYYLWAAGVDAKYMSQMELYEDDELEVLPHTMYDELTVFQKNVLTYMGNKSSDWSLNQYQFDVSMAGGKHNTFTYSTPYYKWNNGQKDFLVNMGYYEKGRKSITISFPYAGVYRFDDLQVVSLGMPLVSHQADALAEEHLENVEMGINTITGNLMVSRDKMLCLSIPNDAGWTAYVDGKETPIYAANIMYMGIPVKAGYHTIELRYHTVGLREGIMISLAGFGFFVVLVIWNGVKRKSEKQNSAGIKQN